eukprot:CAMPEP_0172912574 /NCGR_PEP_ID=MMETSP1075-20121228/188688_1 /TAXON_ID=2916 /ORGANISM="Ceratium fusus, Strain PA161109" /LENGTH=81 /DNA_ID=CAMNT_0013771099 /DNA_START=66 /DNA_END=309 /DNA_ORIENTATION=-
MTLATTVGVQHADHVIKFLITWSLATGSKQEPEFADTYETIAIKVYLLESLTGMCFFHAGKARRPYDPPRPTSLVATAPCM